MNVVHLLSQNHLTGAEVYATTLAEKQLKDGFRVYQVSNGFFSPTLAVPFKLNVETDSKTEFIRNVFWLRNYIKKENIQVVHSHSRAASKLGFYATLFSKTAHVSTIHGRQHPSFSKIIFNQYGQFIITVCENVKKQVYKDFGYNIRKIQTVPNPIDVQKFSSSEINSQSPSDNLVQQFKVAIVGRATGPKKERSRLAIESLLRNYDRYQNLKLFLVGAKLKEIISEKRLVELSLSYEQIQNILQIQELDRPHLSGPDYKSWDTVIGSGRVAIESALSGTTTIAFGEAVFEGLLTFENIELFLESNFGDMHTSRFEPSLTDEELLIALDAAFIRKNNSDENLKIAEKMRAVFDSEFIHARIKRIYESAFFQKNYSRWIPVLMYHKIPDQEIQSKHKIYVTKNDFEKHLKFFKKRGFTTLTFSELSLFRTGKLSFNSFPKKPLILTFDDGYKDNLLNASPLLKKYGFKAQVFLLADSKINSNKWDADSEETPHEIVTGDERILWKSSAFEVGSHGFSHQPITFFKNRNEALAELTGSKKSLEKEFGYPIQCFAFTYGITIPNADQLAFNAGYEYAVNTDSGGLTLEENPYAIFRVNVFPDENYWSLFKKTSRWYRNYFYFKRNK
jgi:peptidoglycan/xylan/chitin deacetylase (PgdA/CDA1 family)